MARGNNITYRNVAGVTPANTTSANALIRDALNAPETIFSGLSDAIGKYSAFREENDTEALQTELRGLSDNAARDRFLSNLSPEQLAFADQGDLAAASDKLETRDFARKGEERALANEGRLDSRLLLAQNEDARSKATLDELIRGTAEKERAAKEKFASDNIDKANAVELATEKFISERNSRDDLAEREESRYKDNAAKRQAELSVAEANLETSNLVLTKAQDIRSDEQSAIVDNNRIDLLPPTEQLDALNKTITARKNAGKLSPTLEARVQQYFDSEKITIDGDFIRKVDGNTDFSPSGKKDLIARLVRPFQKKYPTVQKSILESFVKNEVNKSPFAGRFNDGAADAALSKDQRREVQNNDKIANAVQIFSSVPPEEYTETYVKGLADLRKNKATTQQIKDYEYLYRRNAVENFTISLSGTSPEDGSVTYPLGLGTNTGALTKDGRDITKRDIKALDAFIKKQARDVGSFNNLTSEEFTSIKNRAILNAGGDLAANLTTANNLVAAKAQVTADVLKNEIETASQESEAKKEALGRNASVRANANTEGRIPVKVKEDIAKHFASIADPGLLPGDGALGVGELNKASNKIMAALLANTDKTLKLADRTILMRNLMEASGIDDSGLNEVAVDTTGDGVFDTTIASLDPAEISKLALTLNSPGTNDFKSAIKKNRIAGLNKEKVELTRQLDYFKGLKKAPGAVASIGGFFGLSSPVDAAQDRLDDVLAELETVKKSTVKDAKEVLLK